MLISPNSPMSSTVAGVSRSHTENRSSLVMAERNVSIDFSGDGDTVTLTETNSVIKMDTSYSSSSIVWDSRPAPVTSGLVASSGTAGTEEAALGEQTIDDYLDVIRDRVEYLLKDAAEKAEEYRRMLLGGERVLTGSGVAETSETVEIMTESTSVTLDMANFSAESTASRIVQFALSFYDGGDREAYVAEIRSAVMKGFNEAKAAFGGFLPEVSYRTIEMVNDAFNSFAAGEDA